MILPSWFPSRSDKSAGLRLLTRPAEKSASDLAVVGAASETEWICTNSRGSFAMGTVDRRARRKYHSLLTVREPGVGGPLNLLAELEDWFDIGDEGFALHSHDWGNVIEPDGMQYLVGFDSQPRWIYRFRGLTVTRELWLDDGEDAVWIRYTIEGLAKPATLRLRPLIRYRPLHGLTFANPLLNGEVAVEDAGFLKATMEPYAGSPPLVLSIHGAQASFEADGHWYEGVHYAWEAERGYDHVEDLFTPGEFQVGLVRNCSLSIRLSTAPPLIPDPEVLAPSSAPSRSFLQELDQAADAYLVKLHGDRASVIAGYPWFGEWSRDALIALPGLCLTRNKIDDALAILESLADRRENGLIPNIPKSRDISSNLNAIDASLLFIRATTLTAKRTRSRRVVALREACLELLQGILEGADPRVRVDREGFLFVEEGPWALTWMDAMVDGKPVTARWGYAVDLNALWLFGLATGSRWAKKSRPEFARILERTARKLARRFEEKFWLQDDGFLTDTHDGEDPDRKLRPNQLWALALPNVPLGSTHKRRALQAVADELLTPVGLRTLSPKDVDYQPIYGGEQVARDLAYHQGTVWPWLLGLYADALIAIKGSDAVETELLPVLASLCTHLRTEGCIGQIGEVFDGDPPHSPGGAPAQAWSVAEVLRIAKMAVP